MDAEDWARWIDRRTPMGIVEAAAMVMLAEGREALVDRMEPTRAVRITEILEPLGVLVDAFRQASSPAAHTI